MVSKLLGRRDLDRKGVTEYNNLEDLLRPINGETCQDPTTTTDPRSQILCFYGGCGSETTPSCPVNNYSYFPWTHQEFHQKKIFKSLVNINIFDVINKIYYD